MVEGVVAVIAAVEEAAAVAAVAAADGLRLALPLDMEAGAGARAREKTLESSPIPPPLPPPPPPLLAAAACRASVVNHPRLEAPGLAVPPRAESLVLLLMSPLPREAAFLLRWLSLPLP